jgi:magnesium transporter
MAEDIEGLAERLTHLLEEGEAGRVRELLADRQPADIADAVEQLSDEQARAVFELLSPEIAGSVLDELGERATAALLEALPPERTSDILEEMPSDEAADALGDMDAEDAQQVIDLMTPREARQARELLEYDEHSAGGLMATEFAAVEPEMTAGQVIARLREIADEVESIYDIYVVSPDRHLVGLLTLRDLVVAPPDRRVGDIMRRDVVSVSADLDQEEVARLVSRYDLLTIPVVDDDHRLIGMVTVDDIMEVMEEETSEDVYRLSGAADAPHRAEARPLSAIVASRLTSLMVLLAAGAAGAWLIWHQRAVLQLPLAAATLVPLFLLVGGNVGGQAAGSMLASLGGESRSREGSRALAREGATALLLGAGCAALVYAVARIVHQPSSAAATAAAAVMIAVFLADLLGAFVPWLARRWGADPAATVSPLVTSLCDLASLAVYVVLVSALASPAAMPR